MPDILGLSHSEQIFLLEQKIPLSLLFDAQLKPVTSIENQMREVEAEFAYNCKPCRKHGHKLRSRSNSCIQCNTANIGFQLRGKLDGYLYLLGSGKAKLLKIGFTKNGVNDRISLLNHIKYAQASDWQIIAYFKGERVAKLEVDAHKALNDYSVAVDYARDGREQKTYETYSCSAKIAYEEMRQLAPKDAEWKVNQNRLTAFS